MNLPAIYKEESSINWTITKFEAQSNDHMRWLMNELKQSVRNAYLVQVIKQVISDVQLFKNVDEEEIKAIASKCRLSMVQAGQFVNH